jgi:hypothetical protein
MLVITMAVLESGTYSYGWEFSLKGTFTWKYDNFSQMGPRGLFGAYDRDNSGPGPGGYGGSPGSAASMNGWLGYQIGQISSGSDLALATTYMRLYPEFKINRALRVRGSYRIGQWATPDAPTSRGDLVRSEYADATAPGLQRSFSAGYWETLWVSAQIPWGIVALGKRPAPFGTALMFDGYDNAEYGGLLVLVPFGPIRVGGLVSPFFLGLPVYFTRADKNGIRQVDVGGLITYDAGPLTFGLAGRYWRYRIGPEAATFQGSDGAQPTGRIGVVPTNTAITDGTVYIKYFNGRVFFNAEAGWGYEITKRQKWLAQVPGLYLPDGSGRSRFASNYIEHWRFMIETGGLAGPAKLAILWSWVPGPDRRHGIRIEKQEDLRIAQLSNVSLFRPYSLLLSYNYAAGNDSFARDSRNGYMTDANVYGARVDYAVAANVNLFATFFWADRISNGYGWGFIRPAYSESEARFTGTVQFLEADQYNGGAPSIPDGNLGYEIDWGFIWKLLEGYTVTATFGIWQPGAWFKFACVDRSVPGWKTPNVTNQYGANPDRSIDAVFGMELRLEADF